MYELIRTYAADVVGVVALAGLILFIVSYSRAAIWKATREGRSVMYLTASLALTIVLLVLHGFTGGYPYRWVVEVVIYSPLAWAAWHIAITLRRAMGMEPRYLIRVRRKPEDGEVLEDTQP